MEAHDCHYGTPLHVACARQHFDCAKVLLNSGECTIGSKSGCEYLHVPSPGAYCFPVVNLAIRLILMDTVPQSKLA